MRTRPLSLSPGFGLALALAACRSEGTTLTDLPEPPAPLVASAPATAAELCSGTELRSWELLAPTGEVLAETRGVCRPAEADAPAPHELISQLRQDDRVRYELHLWIGDDAKPVAGQLREPTSTRYYAWSDAGMQESHLGDARTRPLEADGSPTWVIPSHALIVREFMLRAAVGREGDSLHQRSFAPDRERLSDLHLVPVRRTALAESADTANSEDSTSSSLFPEAIAEIALDGGRFQLRGPDEQATLGQLAIAGYLADDATLVYREQADPQPLESLLPEQPRPAYRPGADLEIRTLTVTGTDGAPELAAEIVVAHDGATVQRPGVLFISDAGAQDRHGITRTGVDVGSHEIHDALARAGFAVLRYDERGVGETPVGDDATPGFDATVDDARRALRALAQRPEVDPSRVILIGHGEGAIVASKLASEKVRELGKKRQPQAVVLLAAPGRGVAELIYDEVRRSHRDRSPEEIEAAVAQAKAVHEAALADGDLPAAAEPLREWMQQILPLQPLSLLKKVRAPVLLLQGGKDFQVNPTLDFAAIEATLQAPSEARLFPNLDHLLKPEPGESHAGHYRDLSRHVDPVVAQAIVDWVRGLESR